LTETLRIASLSLRSFRNLESVELHPAPRVNVISGDNGAGKTSLLEALYFVATSKSFRTEQPRELIREGDEAASVRIDAIEGGQQRQQRAAITARERSLLLDGNKPDRVAWYAVQTPIVVFHPGDLELASGGAAVRRVLLDRLALFFEPSSADHRLRFQRALKERQRLLDDRGPTAAGLDIYEELMARHGAAWTAARRRASERLVGALHPAFLRVATPGLELAVAYRSASSEDVEVFRTAVESRRGVDARRRCSGYGPQRDDLELAIAGKSARRHASQGQQRILALALKLAELECVKAARGVHPILLLDDVSSELDPARAGAVYSYLRDAPGQVFVSTTRPELFTTPEVQAGERADWRVSGGRILPLTGY
jgi:DNA replication and repair protein RecF